MNPTLEMTLQVCLLALQTVDGVVSERILQELLLKLPDIAFPDPTLKENPRLSEEVRLSTVSILLCLFSSPVEDRGIDLAKPAYQPVLAHNISMLLHFLSLESFITLKSASVRAIGALAERLRTAPDRTAQFLPGVLSALGKLLASSKESQKVIVASLDVAGLLISTCLSDEACLPFMPVPSFADLDATLPPTIPSPTGVRGSTELLKRSDSWRQQTAANIAKILPSFLHFSNHDIVAVRLAAARLAVVLIETCTRSLASSHGALCETLLYLVGDSSEQVAAYCTSAIERCLHSPDCAIWFQISLERGLATLLDDFPKAMKGVDDGKRKRHLALLNNHIAVLKHACYAIVRDSLPGVVGGLFSVLEPELSDVRVVQDSTGSAFDQIGKQVGFPKKKFRQFHDDTLYPMVETLVGLLSLHCPRELVEETQKLAQTSPAHQYQGILILNQVCRHAPDSLVEGILNDYLELDFLHRASNSKDSKLFIEDSLASAASSTARSASASVAESNLLICKTTAVLEGLSLAADRLTPQQFAYLMMDGLYVMLEKLGDSNYLISSASSSCLQVFAKRFAELEHHEMLSNALVCTDTPTATVSHLVLAHIDYLIDSISHKLRYVTLHPMAPRVLVAAINVAGSAVVGPLTTDCVDQVLDILDELGTSGYIDSLGPTVSTDTEYSIMGELLNVLLALLKTVAKDHASPVPEANRLEIHEQGSPPASADVSVVCSSPMREFLEREREFARQRASFSNQTEDAETFFTKLHRKEPKTEAQDALDEESLAASMSSKEKEEAAPPLTAYETLTLSILERTSYFLSSDSPRIRAAVLEMFALGIPLLAHQSAVLYPLIHKIWPAVVRKCRDPSHFVVVRALTLVKMLATFGKDFVRQRIQKDVVHHLLALLQSLQKRAQEGHSKHGAEAKALTPKISSKVVSPYLPTTRTEVDLFYETLSALGEIVSHVPLTGDQQHELVQVLMGFLHTGLYSAPVVDQATLILQGFAATCPDWLWLVLFLTLGGSSLPSLRTGGSGAAFEAKKRQYAAYGRPSDYSVSAMKLIGLFADRSQQALLQLVQH
ncbi:TEL2-interacting protein 1 [Kappamyces sp. JEL0680]|nr:TEL2-interacting protein 1 [Kappamyces sp. JEL0680]